MTRSPCHRHFCCNAIYWDPDSGRLLDPTGRGIEDAIARRLRVPTDRYITKNQWWIWLYLRMRRNGFTAEPATRAYACEAAEHLVRIGPSQADAPTANPAWAAQILRVAGQRRRTREHLKPLLEILV